MGSEAHRQTVLDAAAALLAEGGRNAVTTRSVAAAAGVQPPLIYRLFGDMGGLLDAVATEGFERYMVRKRAIEPSGDPVDDLRAGWDLHVGFGVEHPSHYLLMYGDPRRGTPLAATAEAMRILIGLVTRAAEAGRLVEDVEAAAAMIHAAGVGVTLRLIEDGVTSADVPLAVRTREAILAAITGASPAPGTTPVQHALAVRVGLSADDPRFTPGERLLLDELLARV